MGEQSYEEFKAARLAEARRRKSATPGPSVDAAAIGEAAGQSRQPSVPEAALRGAAQVGTRGYVDEGVGLFNAIRQLPQHVIEAIRTPGGRGGEPLVERTAQDYREPRDDWRKQDAAAFDAHPVPFIAGGVGAGVLEAMVNPLAAPESALGAIGSGIVQSGIAGLGASEADLTKGDFAGAAKDTALAAGTGGLLTAGITGAIKAPAAIAARLSKNKAVGALTEYVQKIINKNGDPQALKSAAGQLMNKAIEAAGDTPLEAGGFLAAAKDLQKKASNPAAGGVPASVARVLKGAEDVAAKEGKMTLAEMHEAMKTYGRLSRAAERTGDVEAKWAYSTASKALRKDLEAATGNSALGEAAALLQENRALYGKAARSADLQNVLIEATDPKSVDKFMSPGKFAALNTGKKLAKIQKLLADDPERLAAWNAAADAARLLAKSGKGWMPKIVSDLSPGGTDAVRNLMTMRNVAHIFEDAGMAKDFLRLVNPNKALPGKEAMALVSSLSARLRTRSKKDDQPEDNEPSEPQDAVAPRELRAAREPTARPGGSFVVDPANLPSARFTQ